MQSSGKPCIGLALHWFYYRLLGGGCSRADATVVRMDSTLQEAVPAVHCLTNTITVCFKKSL